MSAQPWNHLLAPRLPSSLLPVAMLRCLPYRSIRTSHYAGRKSAVCGPRGRAYTVFDSAESCDYHCPPEVLPSGAAGQNGSSDLNSYSSLQSVGKLFMKKSKQENPEKKPANSSESSVQGKAENFELFPVVGIGASAGGLEAFTEFLRHMPEKTGMAFVLVQHLDPTHGSVLQDILSRATKIPVSEVTDGIVIEPDHVYVIPANTNMAIEGSALRLAARSLIRGQHMPIDYFFRSLAKDRGDRAIGVVLSGTASDGTEGCTAIKAAGGITFAQDEKSAKYDSMPRSAFNSGSVDFVMSPREIGKELVRISKHPYISRVSAEKKEPAEIAQGNELAQLFSMVRNATGVDFTHYKQTTLQRRIKRRMVLHKLEKLKDYVRYIKNNPTELDELYKDILIHVTGFFRDAEAFEALRKQVLPSFFLGRKADAGPVRIWVTGCSTGEEVYSIAITILEYVWEQARYIPPAAGASKEIQIFATDISEVALEHARNGLYSEASVSDVSPERLKRFFMRLDGGYQINKPIREMCIFAKQDLAKDPPFSNLDLITCRNLLIYLGPALQKRVISAMHYGLKPNGYLLLGGSESLGAFADHFALIDKKHKIYQKKKSGARLVTYFTGMEYTSRRLDELRPAKPSMTVFTVEKEVERLLVNRYVPASIVVNDQMEIVQIHGRTGDYLEPASGHPTFSLSRMAREGLLVDLRSALNKAKKDNAAVHKEGVFVRSNGGRREVDLDVIPIRVQGSNERFFVIVFQPPAREAAPPVEKMRGRRGGKSRGRENVIFRENERLTREVAQLKDQLQPLIEEHETTLEEFKSANEEVLSANEELQSTNEELETAKEELQSSNEELTTLNEELQNRNAELSSANNDLLNLLANVNIPVVMVGNDLRIRRFTPLAEKLLNLIPADISRRLGEIRPNLDSDDLEHLVRDTIDSATLHEREVREKGGGWHLLRVRPYKTWDSKIDGAVISFQDIDALKRNIEQTQNYANILFESARESILLLDTNLRVAGANPAFYRTFRETKETTEGRLIYELGHGQWNIPKLRSLLTDIIGHKARIDDFELQHDFPDLGKRFLTLNAWRIEPQPGRPMIFLSIEDITEKTNQLDALKRQHALLEHAHDAIMVRDLEGRIQFWNRGAEEMYGWKSEEVLGKLKQDVLKSKFPKPKKDIEAELLRRGYWEGELLHTRTDGSIRTIQSRWVARDEGGSPVVLEINSDITDKKHTEASVRELSSYLIRLQDEERRRIARELHDSAGQKLAFAKMSLDTLVKQRDLGGNSSSLTESVKSVDEAIREIRTLAQLLHPPLLDEAGLGAAVGWLADGFAQRAGVTVDVKFPPALRRLPENVEIALFRVIQEALGNVHRHSEATKAEISLADNSGSVTLRISDNGKGMKVNSSRETPAIGVGIQGMKERLAQLGGTLEISSGSSGTTITATVPNLRGGRE